MSNQEVKKQENEKKPSSFEGIYETNKKGDVKVYKAPIIIGFNSGLDIKNLTECDPCGASI